MSWFFLQVVVATKANPWENKTLSSASVSEQMGCSLTSLQSSSVDIFYLHAPDHNTPLEETLQGVNTLHQGQPLRHSKYG